MRYSIPLDDIIDSKENIYKLATVAIKEAEKLAKESDEYVEREYGDSKLVSVALSKVFNNEVEYRDNSDKFVEKKGR